MPSHVWRAVTSAPVNETSDGYLSGISARANNDVWAVGIGGDINNGPPITIQHFDGEVWTGINPGQYGMTLLDVHAVDHNDVWAVGFTDQSRGATQPLALHWDGEKWRIVTSTRADEFAFKNSVVSVHGASSDDVWAVGSWARGDDTDKKAFSMHWDGLAWRNVPCEVIGTSGSRLMSVASLDRNHAWAVGNSRQSLWGPSKALILEWNGDTWKPMSNPVSSSDMFSSLSGIAAFNPNDVIAVGSYGTRPMAMRFDGKGWSFLLPPGPPGAETFTDVAGRAGNSAWAVGPFFVDHWDGQSWTLDTTVNIPHSTANFHSLDSISVVRDTGTAFACGHRVNSHGVPQPLVAVRGPI